VTDRSLKEPIEPGVIVTRLVRCLAEFRPVPWTMWAALDNELRDAVRWRLLLGHALVVVEPDHGDVLSPVPLVVRALPDPRY
jgi:hypothetical protein